MCVEHTVDGGAGDAVSASDLSQAHAMLVIPQDGIEVQVERQAGAPHAGTNPLDDQVAFQFRDGADDDHYGAAQWSAGIDLFAEADELDVEPI